jgi:hypothetical protein
VSCEPIVVRNNTQMIALLFMTSPFQLAVTTAGRSCHAA